MHALWDSCMLQLAACAHVLRSTHLPSSVLEYCTTRLAEQLYQQPEDCAKWLLALAIQHDGYRLCSASGRRILVTGRRILVTGRRMSHVQVMAGALQDNKRATIADETTFGKGLIQTIVELSDGSAVSVTVARYQTPAGTDINKVGIKPDIALEDQTLLPTDGPKFCKVMASGSAPKLFL